MVFGGGVLGRSRVAGWAGFPSASVPFVAGGSVDPVSVEGGADGLPGGRDDRRPAPGRVDAQADLAGAVGDAGGGVQDPVAGRRALGAAPVRVGWGAGAS